MARRKARLAAVFLLLAAALPLVFFLSGTRLSVVDAPGNDVEVYISRVIAWKEKTWGDEIVDARNLRVQGYTIDRKWWDHEEWTNRYTPEVQLVLGQFAVQYVRDREIQFADGKYRVAEYRVVGGLSVFAKAVADGHADETIDWGVMFRVYLGIRARGNVTIANVVTGKVMDVECDSTNDHSGEWGWYEDSLGHVNLHGNSRMTLYKDGKVVDPRSNMEAVFAAYRELEAQMPDSYISVKCLHRSWFTDPVADDGGYVLQDSKGTVEIIVTVWAYQYVPENTESPGLPGVSYQRNVYTSGLWLAVQWFVYVLLAGVVLYILARVLPPLVSAVTAKRWRK